MKFNNLFNNRYMEDITNLSNKKKNHYLTTPEKVQYQNIKDKEMNDSGYSLTNKNYEDSVIKEDEIDVNMSTNEYISYKERQLSILLNTFEISYSNKFYKELIKEIEEKEDLLYQNSLMSFKIKILKIKTLMKLLMKEYNNYLQVKNKSFHDLDEIIHKIKKEFHITSMILINTDSYVYEITTQIYCKFLYILSKISLEKEDYIKNLGYITLGINMLKIFFIRKKFATDIKTYIIYCKLGLEILNSLIGDKNYEQALYYIRLLLQIIEKSMKIIYYNNNTKIIPKTINKFIKFGSIVYIYTGCCLEHLDEQIQAFEAYKEAKFFFQKSAKLGFSFPNFNTININNSCSYLVEEVFEKLKLKFIKDKIENFNRQKRLELQKKKNEIESLQKEKLMKLKFIANGIEGNPFKLEKLENKLNTKIFPTSVVNNLEKIDNDLTSFVFSYFDKNKDNIISLYDGKMSQNTKKLMSRYEVYNILMSKGFRGFIMKTKKLQFYNPKTASNSISIIQSHLNKKIQIESNSKTIIQKKPLNLENNDLKQTKRKKRMSSIENLFNLTNYPNSQKEGDIIKKRINFLKRKKNKFKNYNFNFPLSRDKESKSNKLIKEIFPSFTLNKTKSKGNKKFKYKLKKKFKDLEIDFERKNLDKRLMTKNYLRKYSYYDKLSERELKFQKDLLYFKSNNTLYNTKSKLEEKNGILGKDDLSNISLIVNERAKEKAKPVVEENLIDIDLLKGSFGPRQNKISLKMKSAMSSVITNYINERKNQTEKERLVNNKKIKKDNEKKLFYLDDSINNINNNISKIKYLILKSK